MNSIFQHKFARLSRPSWICAFISCFYLVFIIATNTWDPMSLIRVGGHFDPRIGGQEMGYDGQFAYQIARDPMNGWQYVDLPSYRYQRILYPVVSMLLSFGNDALLPWVMILINLVSIIMGVYLLEKILVHYGQSRWPAISYGLFIGTLMSLRLCLNEPLAYALAIGGTYLYIRGRLTSSAICLGLAVLTKEVTILFAAAFIIYLLFRSTRSGIFFGLLACIPFLLWKIVLFTWFHDWGLSAGGAMATTFEWLPYAGWWKLANVTLSGFLTISVLIVPLVIIPSILAIYISVRKFLSHQVDEFTLLLFFTAILIPFLPSSNILDPLGVSRALMGLVIAWLVFGARNQSKRILNYCYLFALTGIFTWKDTFLPVGTFSQDS